LAKQIEKIVDATLTYTKVMADLSAKEAASEPAVDFAKLPNIQQKRSFQYTREKFTLNDPSRDRQFYVILYKPTQARSPKIPVVIVSHGLASKPEDFEDIAKHLASYGFVVALPQHPGSDFQQAKNLLEGYSREVFDINEFVNRPKDISATIDELERRNATEFGGQLDTQNVGVIGHSFGGYTALAVAGAEIDFDYLQSECDRIYSGLNTSLLLQCRALSIPRKVYSFRDPRVKAILAGNPVNSSIFGEKGLSKIDIPVAFISGNYDPATPAVFEQMRSFIWLKTPNKYLILAEGQAHVDFSELDAGISDALKAVPDLTLPEPSLLHGYRDPLVLAYFEVYTAQNTKFYPYFSSAYAAYLSQNKAFNVYLISGKSEPGLIEAIEKFKAKY
jgi:predicted dienelactone hydrolase